MSKAKKPNTFEVASEELRRAAELQRRDEISSLFSTLTRLEKAKTLLAKSKNDNQVKIEFPMDNNYTTYYFRVSNIAPALLGVIAIEIAEVKEKLIALGVQP